MPKKDAIRDPVLGELCWAKNARMWRGRVPFTPKHLVSVALYAGVSFKREFGWDRILARIGDRYLAHRQREWEFRLAVAETLLEAAQYEPLIEEEIGSCADAVAVARRLILAEIELYPTGPTVWHFHVARSDGFTALLEVAEDGHIHSIEF